MPRPRSKQFPENQGLILDRAAELFARLGFHGASISELARECKFSKAALYHYYESKQAILFALLDQHLSELDKISTSAIASSDVPAQQFQNFVIENMKFYVNKVNHHIVLNRDIRYLPDDKRREIRDRERDLLQRFTDLLTLIKPELAQSPGSDKIYAMLFYGMLNWTYTWFDAHGPVQPEQFAMMAADLYLHGLENIEVPMISHDKSPTGNLHMVTNRD